MLSEKISRKLAQKIPFKSIKMRNTDAVVSFTFDDFPKTAASAGAEILEKHGFAGTFYTCGGLWDKEDNGIMMAGEGDMMPLKDGGHEIGCHTYSHSDCQQLSGEDLEKDLQKNIQLLEEKMGQSLSSFAFPFGKMDRKSQRIAAEHYATARSVVPGLNQGSASLYALKAYSIYSDSFDIGRFETILEEAIASNAWLIFYTHDVVENPSAFGCSPSEFEALVALVEKHSVKVLPVKHALGYVGFSA